MNRVLICIFLLLSYKPLWAEETTTACADWTLTETFAWTSCNWDAEWKEDTKESLKDAAVDNLKALAMQALIDQIPGGTILASFIGGGSGPSEIQMALETILKALKDSENRLREVIVNLDKLNNSADLETLKYHIHTHQFFRDELYRMSHREDLNEYQKDLVGILNHLAIYTDPILGQTIAGNIDTYHTYLATTALRIQLLAEYMARDYSEGDRSDSDLSRDLGNELEFFMSGTVFPYVNEIDWRAGALHPITEYSFTKDNIPEEIGFYSKVSFKFNDESNSIVVNCPYTAPKGIIQPATYCTLTHTGKALTKNLNILSGHQSLISFNDFNQNYKTHWNVVTIYNTFIDNYEISMIKDAYSSTQSVLDSWYKLIDQNGARPPNYADLRLLEYAAQQNIDDGMLAETSKQISSPYSIWAGASGRVHTFDIDGNGQEDFLFGPKSTGEWYLMKSNSGELVDYGEVLNGYAEWQTELDRIRTMDVNGDGMDDLVIGPKSSGEWYVHISNGEGFEAATSHAWADIYGNWWQASSRIWEVDSNNDNKADILLGPSTSGKWYLLESTGTSFINRGAIASGFSNWASHSNRMRLADLNGDGRNELLIGPSSSGAWYTMEFSGSQLIKRTISTNLLGSWWDNPERIFVADLDGNNKDDILIGPESNGNWYALMSNGSSLVYDGIWSNALGNWWSNTDQIRIMDIDGDNKDDIVIGPEISGEWHALKSTGSSLEYAKYLNQSYGNYSDNPERIFVLDQDGDGKKDIIIGPDEATGGFGLIKTQ